MSNDKLILKDSQSADPFFILRHELFYFLDYVRKFVSNPAKVNFEKEGDKLKMAISLLDSSVQDKSFVELISDYYSKFSKVKDIRADAYTTRNVVYLLEQMIEEMFFTTPEYRRVLLAEDMLVSAYMSLNLRRIFDEFISSLNKDSHISCVSHYQKPNHVLSANPTPSLAAIERHQKPNHVLSANSFSCKSFPDPNFFGPKREIKSNVLLRHLNRLSSKVAHEASMASTYTRKLFADLYEPHISVILPFLFYAEASSIENFLFQMYRNSRRAELKDFFAGRSLSTLENLDISTYETIFGKMKIETFISTDSSLPHDIRRAYSLNPKNLKFLVRSLDDFGEDPQSLFEDILKLHTDKIMTPYNAVYALPDNKTVSIHIEPNSADYDNYPILFCSIYLAKLDIVISDESKGVHNIIEFVVPSWKPEFVFTISLSLDGVLLDLGLSLEELNKLKSWVFWHILDAFEHSKVRREIRRDKVFDSLLISSRQEAKDSKVGVRFVRKKRRTSPERSSVALHDIPSMDLRKFLGIMAQIVKPYRDESVIQDSSRHKAIVGINSEGKKVRYHIGRHRGDVPKSLIKKALEAFGVGRETRLEAIAKH